MGECEGERECIFQRVSERERGTDKQTEDRQTYRYTGKKGGGEVSQNTVHWLGDMCLKTL